MEIAGGEVVSFLALPGERAKPYQSLFLKPDYAESKIS